MRLIKASPVLEDFVYKVREEAEGGVREAAGGRVREERLGVGEGSVWGWVRLEAEAG